MTTVTAQTLQKLRRKSWEGTPEEESLEVTSEDRHKPRGCECDMLGQTEEDEKTKKKKNNNNNNKMNSDMGSVPGSNAIPKASDLGITSKLTWTGS